MTSLPITRVLWVVALTACGGQLAAPVPTTSIVSLEPSGGATGVNSTAPIVITFSYPMAIGMEQYVALHEGDLNGTVVAMTCTWSAERTVLTCTPQAPLAPATRYTLHLGGGMRDQMGGGLDYDQCIGQHGGQWATGGMMGTGSSTMMGPGWRHANGSYGMVFTFTTA